MSNGAEDATIKGQMLENQSIIDALNAKLARKTQEVRVIQQIASEMNSTLDLDDILNIILRSMDEVLGFKHSMILLLHPSEPKLTLVASRGYDQTGVGAEVSVGQGVIGIVAKRRRIVRMGNIRSQLAYSTAVRQQMEQAGHQLQEVVQLPGLADVDSQIGIPLLIKDRLVGVFSVESNQPNAFDELDEVLLMILANQAASVIDNARLYQAEKERLAELNKAYASLEQLNASLEGKVQARTAELSGALEEVNTERQRSMELLERMVPKPVIPLMLEDKLEPRRLTSSILFTDMEGFTQFTSNMEPDEMFSQLNYFFSQVGDQIETYRGYVNKTNGDSIMALFGVPHESQTHAIDAVLAGLRMQADVDHHHSLRMRVGINTGVITAGLLGPEKKSMYDVLGDAVNVASRMEKLCAPGGVTISESTYQLVAPYFEVEPLGEQEVKGKGATQVYQVNGLRPLQADQRRVDRTSRFAREYLDVVIEVERLKEEHLQAIDYLSIQARDGALLHNEAAATFALAFLRFLKANTQSNPIPKLYWEQLEALPEDDLVLFMMVHDLGKHAIDPALLNDGALARDARTSLIGSLREHTCEALKQLDLQGQIPLLNRFYQFQESRCSLTEIDPVTVLAAIADMYDALTAPKIYKGKPWSIQGTLEEILRTPYSQSTQCPIVRNFVDFMRPESKEIKATVKATKLFR